MSKYWPQNWVDLTAINRNRFNDKKTLENYVRALKYIESIENTMG